jgi:hypothetical protein
MAINTRRKKTIRTISMRVDGSSAIKQAKQPSASRIPAFRSHREIHSGDSAE